MRPGQESKTSVMVCMGRAIAHGATSVARFEDPTAMALLPEEARGGVERFRAGAPRRLRERLAHAMLKGRSLMMVARTVAIDDAVRARPSPQVVILGAGLDGRAFRMQELRDSVVFEVDHPDTQARKQARVAALTQAAREVRFVPVNFEKDDLDERLSAAGHDPAHPTTWIWEGVVMYLTPADVEATLAVVGRRSAPGSRLIIAYHSPALVLWFMRPLLRRAGEPLRSAFTAGEMRALAARHGFAVVRDEDIRAIGASLGSDVARATRHMQHMRIAIVERR